MEEIGRPARSPGSRRPGAASAGSRAGGRSRRGRRRGLRGCWASTRCPSRRASATGSCTAGRVTSRRSWSTTPCSPSSARSSRSRRSTCRAASPASRRWPARFPDAAAGGLLRHRVPPARCPRWPAACPCRAALADAAGIRRYGFHGLSYEYVVEHVGAGRRSAGRSSRTSATGRAWPRCATGAPVDTTMGLTPAGGFMMGTRTGDLDPGVLVYLMREKGYDADGARPAREPRVGAARASRARAGT